MSNNPYKNTPFPEFDNDKVDYALEPKFDGLSVEIAYRHGSFEYAATRGDGNTGDDISENVIKQELSADFRYFPE